MLALPVLLVAQLRFSSSSSLLFVGCASVSGALSPTTRTRPSSRTARVLTCIRAAAYSDFATGCCKHRSSCCSTSRGTPPPRNWKVSVHRARVCDLRWGLGLGPGLCFTSCGHAGRVLPPGRGDRCGAESWGLRHCSARRGSGVYRENFGVKGGITFGASSGKMTSVASRDGGRQLRQRKETHMSLSTQAIGRKKTKGVAREATSTDDEMELRQGIEESAAATEFEARLWDLDKSNKLTTLTVLELRGYMKLMSKPTAGRKDELISTVKEWLANRETSTLKQGPAIQETSSDAESLEGALLKAESKNREAKAEVVSRRMDIPPKKGNQKKKDAAVPETKAALKDAAESAALKRKSGDAQMSAKGKLSKADPEGDGSLEEENTVKVATKKKSQSLNAVKSNDVGSVTPSEDQGKKRKLEQVAKNLQEETNLQVVEEKVVEINVDPKKPWLTLTHKKPKADWVPYDPDTMRPAALPSSVKSMKFLSWNVNGLRALLKEKDKKVQEGLLLMQLAKEEDFDVLCLQETKLQSRDVDQITATLLPEYTHGYWSCSTAKLGYSGTAIISRVEPLSMTYGIGVPDHDNEGRLITVEFDAFYLVTSYVPNSGDKLVRLAYRTEEWDPALSQYLKELEKKKPVILTGDLNCSNDEIDISNPDGNRKSAGFTNEERESFKTNFLNKGLVDTFRQQHPNAVGYTYWGYRTQARSKNNGWRLDYFLVSEGLVNQIHDSYIRPDVMGSDHCPIGLIVKV